MQTITTIGLDIAKSVFQVHGVDADGQLVSGPKAGTCSRLRLKKPVRGAQSADQAS